LEEIKIIDYSNEIENKNNLLKSLEGIFFNKIFKKVLKIVKI
jgi:hypothetical protein